MTYRELTMIARETGTDRNTVGRYVNAAKEAGLVPAESQAPSAELRSVYKPARCSRAARSGRQWIAQWLEGKRPLQLSKIHTLLVRDRGLDASYDTLRRFARHERGWHKKESTVRVDDPAPGQEAQDCIPCWLQGSLTALQFEYDAP